MGKEINIKKDEREPIAELSIEKQVANLENIFALYKKQNPVKYKLKKAEFEMKLLRIDPVRQEAEAKRLQKIADDKAKAEAKAKKEAEAKKKTK